jgi:hypothetical protein
MLIARYADALTAEIGECGGEVKLAAKFSKAMRETTHNERSAASNTSFKKTFLSKHNAEHMWCGKVLKGETNMFGESEKPEISPSLQGSVKDVQALRNLIFSDKMYTNPVLCSKFLAGLESGHIRGLKKRNPAPITEISGLWLALSARNYRHTAGIPDNVDRKKKWLKMATLVFEDRKNNGKDAHERRAKDLPEIPNDDSDNGGEDATLGVAFYA